jgi:hypothetical protein
LVTAEKKPLVTAEEKPLVTAEKRPREVAGKHFCNGPLDSTGWLDDLA